MRTSDFSRAPRQGRAEAMVIAEFPLHSSARVRRERVELRSAAGYVWHTSFRRLGVRGIVGLFDTGEHARLYRDALLGGSARAVLMEADPSGYSNGVWRAEGNVMAHIPTFTPTSVETARGTSGPPVADPPGHNPRPGRRAPVGADDRLGEFCRSARRRATNFAESVRRRGRPGRQGRRGRRGRPGRPGRPVTDARAMFIGATKYTGVSALVQLSRTWYPMVARMARLRGYVWHTVYWEPPFTLGTLAFFASRDDLLSFARLPAHRTLMQWITRDTKNGSGGYIRLHLAPGEARTDARSETGTP